MATPTQAPPTTGILPAPPALLVSVKSAAIFVNSPFRELVSDPYGYTLCPLQDLYLTYCHIGNTILKEYLNFLSSKLLNIVIGIILSSFIMFFYGKDK